MTFSDLPLWRKMSIGLALCLFFSVGFKLFNEESEIYASAPDVPRTATRQIYPVHVNHGYTRYVTPETAQNLATWRAAGPAVIALALILAGVLLVTHREPVRTVADQDRASFV